jgi:hypothetical protein
MLTSSQRTVEPPFISPAVLLSRAAKGIFRSRRCQPSKSSNLAAAEYHRTNRGVEIEVHNFEFFDLKVAGDMRQKLSKVLKKLRMAHFEWRMLEGKGLRGEEGCKNKTRPKADKKRPIPSRRRIWPQRTKDHKRGGEPQRRGAAKPQPKEDGLWRMETDFNAKRSEAAQGVSRPTLGK